jgi:hypothetical protein
LLPQFVKDDKDEIGSQSHFSKSVKGWVFEGASGHQATVWECDEDGQSQPHTHEFDEWLIVVAGEYTICSDRKRVPLRLVSSATFQQVLSIGVFTKNTHKQSTSLAGRGFMQKLQFI